MNRLTQGRHFDAYEKMEQQTDLLCNVTEEAFAMVEQGDLVEIDFDGDEKLIWHALIIKKDYQNSRLYCYLP